MSASQQKPHGAQWHKKPVPLWVPSAIPACRGMDTALFYPARTAPADQEALDACEACAVRQECLDKAMEEEGSARTRYGVRGGKTPDERYRLYRKAREVTRVRRPRGRPRKNPEPAEEEEAA